MPNTLLNTSTTPTLTWAAIPNAIQYHVQFCADQRFKTLLQEFTNQASASVTPAALPNAAKTFWRFRALLSNTLFTDQANTPGNATGNLLRDVAGDTYLAQGFTPGSGNPIKRVILSLKKTGTPAGNIWVEIWTSSGGSPLAITGSATPNTSVASLTTSFATYNFDFTNPIPVAAGTLYFIVLRGDFGIDGVNYAQWEHDAAGGYAGGKAFKADGTPTWSTNGTPVQVFTTQYYKWGTWQPMRSLWVNTAFTVSYTPSGSKWAFIDPDDTTDSYEFAVAPHYETGHEHQRRSQIKNIQGDLLTEYVSTRDVITLSFNATKSVGGSGGLAYVKYDQMAELMRYFNKRKSLYLTAVTDYADDKQERIWKVDFTDRPDVQPLAAGREDYFTVVLPLMESALT